MDNCENAELTQVGSGTKMGELLRRYWLPVATVRELHDASAVRVRILAEDLVLFHDYEGELGLIAEHCPHRRCSLLYGIPESGGIRCSYHGWRYDRQGRCIEQPSEPEKSKFKEKITTPAYPVQELGGLIFAYMGPPPVPVLPRFDYFVEENAIRQIGITHLPVNWFQVMENSFDPVHTEWLHGYLSNYLKTGETSSSLGYFPQTRHEKFDFEEFEFGIIKRRRYVGGSDEDHEWKVGHPVVFPNILKQGRTFQIRVPIDDENTLLYWYDCYRYEGVSVPEQSVVPTYPYPYADAEGNLLIDEIRQQDLMAWISQGPRADRTQEHLGSTDRGVVMFRSLVRSQFAKLEAGEDPIGVIRDPERTGIISLLSDEATIPRPWLMQLDEQTRLAEVEAELRRRFDGSPIREEIIKLSLERERLSARS